MVLPELKYPNWSART